MEEEPETLIEEIESENEEGEESPKKMGFVCASDVQTDLYDAADKAVST
jgi:hypothetical protein